MNFDQTPLKLVQCSSNTLAKKNSSCVTIVGAADKRSITGTFAISLSNSFLPMQLIYGGKTNQSLPRYSFPESFSLSVNEKHFSNSKESVKFLNEIIIPYAEKVRKQEGLAPTQKALIIMDVFTGQMTTEVKDLLTANNILIANVPPNMTRFYQPLDLTVNGAAKRFIAKRFNSWYCDEISRQLEAGTPIEDIDVKLRLSVLKPLHAGWVIDFYNYITSSEGLSIIENGWKSSGIYDAIRLGLENLPKLDPYHDIDPLVEENNEQGSNINLDKVCNLSNAQLSEYQRLEEESDNEDDDDVWERQQGESRNAFDLFDNE